MVTVFISSQCQIYLSARLYKTCFIIAQCLFDVDSSPNCERKERKLSGLDVRVLFTTFTLCNLDGYFWYELNICLHGFIQT